MYVVLSASLCVDIDVLDKTYTEIGVPTILFFMVDNFPST